MARLSKFSLNGGMNMRSSAERSLQVSQGRFFRAAIFTLILALPLSACGPSEPRQRQAFIDFLKARILNKPGIHLPVPTTEERKSWGPYAVQFDVIADFNHELDKISRVTFGDFSSLAANARTIGSLAGHRSEIVQVRDAAGAFPDGIKRQLEVANAARAAFPPQPNDLKAVYDAAYERDVSAAAFWIEAMPALQQAMASYLALIDFLEQHKGSVTVEGPMVSASDPKLLPRLTELMKAMNDNAAKCNALFARAQKLVHGQ